MEVRRLSGKYAPTCKDVSFSLRKGEIPGVSGLVVSRRTEFFETIFDIAHHSEGEIILDGKKVVNKNSRKAIQNGFALLTEERRVTGIISL